MGEANRRRAAARDTVSIRHHASITDVIFEHACGVYNVTRCLDVVRRNPRACGPDVMHVTETFRKTLENNPGIDRRYALSIPLNVALATPLLFVEHPTESILLIDGLHRATRIVASGRTCFMGYVVPLHLQPPLVTPE